MVVNEFRVAIPLVLADRAHAHQDAAQAPAIALLEGERLLQVFAADQAGLQQELADRPADVGLGLIRRRRGGGGDGEAAAPPSLYMPSYVPTKGSGDSGFDIPGPEDMPSALPSEFGEPAAPRGDKITLFVAPQNVSPGERINFNGVYTDGEGARLQVQRKDGGAWTDFPVDATVRGGSFETWIQTSRTGVTKFRVFDPDTRRASNVVTVTIG